jgi:regulatory protein
LTEADKKRLKPYLEKMGLFCSRQERAIAEVAAKLFLEPISEEDKNQVIQELLKQGFLNEQRFAKAFVNDKFRLNSWGKVKIAFMLRAKHVAGDVIEEALEQIDEDDYNVLARSLAERKKRELGKATPVEQQQKIVRFLIQRGFEPGVAWKAAAELV